MAGVVILKSKRTDGRWPNVVQRLFEEGMQVYQEPQEADISLVLSGKFENPVMVQGRRVLFFDPSEWLKELPVPNGWKVYEPVLTEYYDQMVSLAGMTDDECVKAIKDFIDAVD